MLFLAWINFRSTRLNPNPHSALLLAPPSWMGAWGAPTLKPSRVWGTALVAQWVLASTISSLGLFNFNLRPWMPQLHRKLSKQKRSKLIKNSAALKVTSKRKRADGTWMV